MLKVIEIVFLSPEEEEQEYAFTPEEEVEYAAILRAGENADE